MKISTPTYRCPLGRLQPETTDLDAMKQRGWRDQHSVVDFLAAHAVALGLTSGQADQLRSGALRLRYSDYDWRLNSAD